MYVRRQSFVLTIYKYLYTIEVYRIPYECVDCNNRGISYGIT